TTRALGLADVRSPAVARRFEPAVHLKNTYLAHRASAYWVRFRVRKAGVDHLAIRASFLYADLHLYVPLAGGGYQAQKAGLAYPFRDRDVRTNDVVFSLPQRTRADGYYYMRIRGDIPVGIQFNLQSYPEVVNHAVREFYVFGFFFGAVLIICAYSLILFGVIRQKAYLYYGLYVCSLGVFALVDWGFLKRLYPYDTLDWHRLFWTVPFCAMTVFFLFYCQSLLDTRQRMPRLHRLINRLIVVRVGLLLLTGPLDVDFLYEPYLDNGLLGVAFVAGIVSLRQGFRPARYFLAGLALVFTGYLIHTLYVFNIFLLGSQFYFYTAGVAELLCFSVALAHRFRAVERAREQARQKLIEGLQEREYLKEKLNQELERLNGELEEKVIQRTREIERQANEIVRINQLLQEHNRKLEGQVVDISTARVMQKSVTFDEFRLIYPDEEACLRFLDELKWGGGYACRKCGHGKYCKGKKPYTRRCANCRYPESVISFTLFGKLKFPIVKAFYMTFLLSNGKDVTVDELSEMVSLRRQTCWAFKRKVKEIMLSRKHLKKPSDGWSHLVLNVEEVVSE
ncbi:MAG TPA: 7TM diverse intracellular signaling domain-containing protein, partial [Cytophagales bacterium]